jgi:hypothetical protein
MWHSVDGDCSEILHKNKKHNAVRRSTLFSRYIEGTQDEWYNKS